MSRKRGTLSRSARVFFIRRFLGVISQHSISASIAAGIGLTSCLVVAGSIGWPRAWPQATEPPNIIRLRQEWFYNQRAYPLKRIPPGARIRALRQLRQMRPLRRRLKERNAWTSSRATSASSGAGAMLSSTQWTPIGPQPTDNSFLGLSFSPVSGRVTALAVDPTNPDVVYLGAAEGGVWKTTDGGSTWTPLLDNQPSLAVGSIAIDPSNPSAIYVGTGEENFNYDAYFGAGILKSTDGGATWTHISGPFASPYGSGPDQGGAYIGALAVSPSNSSLVLAAAYFASSSSASGLYISRDSGQTWSQALSGPPATSIVFDPTNGNVAYAAFTDWGVYKTTNAGLSWSPENGAAPHTLTFLNSLRISLAIDPKNSGTLYAAVASMPDSKGSITVMGFFKTVDGGANWTAIWTPTTSASPTFPSTYCDPSDEPGQCAYDNVVAVDPGSSSVFIGGSAEGSAPGVGVVWRSEDGGSSWTDTDPPPSSASTQALHPDVHAIAFAADGSRMYVGTDGGVWSTPNVTTSPVVWTSLNNSLALTQFYPGMSILPSNIGLAFGGTQDNGTQEYGGEPGWAAIPPCGDGGWTNLAGTSSPAILYWSCAFGQGLWSFNFVTQSIAKIDSGINSSDRADFIPPFVMDASDPQTLYFGTYMVYQSVDGGNTWNIISSDLTSGPPAFLTTLAVAPSDPATVYAGSSDGHIAKTTTAKSGASGGWSDLSNGSILPRRWVTQIAVDPKTATTAYVTFSGFSGFSDNAGHVFATSNGGASWTDISGNLPNIPVNDIVVDPDVANTLYIATDIGVFMTSDNGGTWNPVNDGLPNVAVLSLKLNEASRVLRAGTHGRSAWDLFVPANLPVAGFSTAAVDFGPQFVNSSSQAQTVMLTNQGAASMTVNGISVTGANASDFTENNNCPSTLAAGASCNITLTFTPAATGTLTANLQASDNAPASPQLVYLTGQGIILAVSVSPARLTFANQNVGSTSAAQAVTLTNTGQGQITVSGISLTGTNPGDFKETDNCVGAVAVGASCAINVTFTPTAPLTRTAILNIVDDAAGSPQMVSLTGTGVGPTANLSSTSLGFSGQIVKTTSAAQIVTLSNMGNANLAISSLTVSGPDSGDFAITASGTSCSSAHPVAPETSCTISVTFTPSASGVRTAMLAIADNASGSPQSVSLAGTGEDFTVAVASGTSSADTVAAGATANYQISVTPASGFNQAITVDCAGAPSLATCTVMPPTVTPDGTHAVTVKVVVTTAAPTLAPGGTPNQPFLPPRDTDRFLPWLCGMLGLLAIGRLWAEGRNVGAARRMRRRNFDRKTAGTGIETLLSRWRLLAPFAAILMGVAMWASCGGSGGSFVSRSPGTPAGTYTLTVTGSSGSLTHSTTLTLTVE
jgi:hypothetical protein